MEFKSKTLLLFWAVVPCFVLLFAACEDASSKRPLSSTTSEQSAEAVERLQVAKNHQEDQEKTKSTSDDSEQLIPSEKESKSESENSEQQLVKKEPASYSDDDEEEEKKPEKDPIEIADNWTGVSEKYEIWIDGAAKHVMIGGTVCLNAGPLEMFICPAGTKEHESLIAANAPASELHRSLLALGHSPGKPSSWADGYRPVHGPIINIELMWRDPDSKMIITENASQWIRDTKTKKAMKQKFVFGGSEIWEDPDTKEKVYYADSGEMVCLSNFSTACIDVNVKSTDSDANLMFNAFTENMPPVGTKVYMIFKPGKIIPPEKVEVKTEDAKAKEASAKSDKVESDKVESENQEATKSETEKANSEKQKTESDK